MMSDRPIEVGFEPQVPVGEDADEPSSLLPSSVIGTPKSVALHQLERL
jgi:hypothetical protein